MIKSTESTANTALDLLSKFSLCLLSYEDARESEVGNDKSIPDDVVHQSTDVVLHIRSTLQRMNDILYRLLDELPSEDINKKFSRSLPEY